MLQSKNSDKEIKRVSLLFIAKEKYLNHFLKLELSIDHRL